VKTRSWRSYGANGMRSWDRVAPMMRKLYRREICYEQPSAEPLAQKAANLSLRVLQIGDLRLESGDLVAQSLRGLGSGVAVTFRDSQRVRSTSRPAVHTFN